MVMRVRLGDTSIFFDAEGAKYIPAGATLREQPTLILIHGAPGFADHSAYKPAFSQLADAAQLLYLDLRGAGRSDRSTPDRWTLEQWADDLHEFCATLGISHPVVLGNSAGGLVVMTYALRHPEQPAKLILSNTQARLDVERTLAAFERRGGTAARNAASAFLRGHPDQQTFLQHARTTGQGLWPLVFHSRE
jgi:pimeloyl-ACP methyl ester carboxylesterase